MFPGCMQGVGETLRTSPRTPARENRTLSFPNILDLTRNPEEDSKRIITSPKRLRNPGTEATAQIKPQ